MRKCRCCGGWFTPRPQNKDQCYCSDYACQEQRRNRHRHRYIKEYIAAWKAENPGYFDYRANPALAHKLSLAVRTWREKHPDYQKDYRDNRRDSYNGYMRNYMRRRRRACGASWACEEGR